MNFRFFLLLFFLFSSCGFSASMRSTCYDFQGSDRQEPDIKKERKIVSFPRIAIIIDDIGSEDSVVCLEELLTISAPLTFAILPEAPNTADAAFLLQKLNREIILHLPLEPHNAALMEKKKFLLLNMAEENTRKLLTQFLESIPGISGVNTHMGSKYTQDENKMKIILDEIQKRGLYFIDSRTDPLTKAEDLAVKMGIMTKHRDCFIDNNKNVEAIVKMLSFLEDTADKNNVAIGIGHPCKETVQALKIWSQKHLVDFEIVPVSEILK